MKKGKAKPIAREKLNYETGNPDGTEITNFLNFRLPKAKISRLLYIINTNEYVKEHHARFMIYLTLLSMSEKQTL